MAKRIKSPMYFEEIEEDAERLAIFLAGGITGCDDWQSEMEQMLSGTDFITFNPRREGMFDTIQPEWGEEQIRWEVDHMSMADIILFWFPKEGMCMITLFELGKCLGSGKRVLVGCDPEYIRAFDIHTQLRLMRPDIKISSSLEDLANRVIQFN